MMIMMITGE